MLLFYINFWYIPLIPHKKAQGVVGFRGNHYNVVNINDPFQVVGYFESWLWVDLFLLLDVFIYREEIVCFFFCY